MGEHKNKEGNPKGFQEQSFGFQMDCLKIEIDLVDRAIARMETITQAIKNFAVLTWAGSITLFLGQTELRKHVIFSALLPLLFWLIDGWWTHLIRGSVLRLKKIKDFINGDDLIESFRQRKLMNFIVLDPYGKQYQGTEDYERFAGLRRILIYREFLLLYGGLTLFSLSLGVVLLIIY